MRFRDRTDAGTRLAEIFATQTLTAPVVLALPRGGVPVAVPVARALGAPLEVFVARKVGAPRRPEYGIGAIAEGGSVVADHHALDAMGVDETAFELLVGAEQQELDRRVRGYRGDRPLPELRARDTILIDDGLATGVTAEAALRALRDHHPSRLLLAVPVGAPETVARLRAVADDVVCARTITPFYAVGLGYERFDQVTDEEVVELLGNQAGETGVDQT